MLKIKSLTYLFFLLSTASLSAGASYQGASRLSEGAEISLLTAATGPDLYKAFGHSAVRVKDPARGIDRVYNYGTFDFSTENFYMKFARGQLNYWLSVSSFENFMAEYVYYDQTVYEHVFNFTAAEKQAVFDFLEHNYLPANRFYLYDFFRDNCSTRIRDIIYEVFGDRASISDSSWFEPRSFREGIDQYINDRHLWHLGMDIGLGAPSDEQMSINEAMFLPEYLMRGFENMTIHSAGGEKPLIKTKRLLIDGTPFSTGKMGLNIPLLALLAIAVAVMILTFSEFKYGRQYKRLDGFIFGFATFLSAALLLLWFGTDHWTTAYNPDLLWTLPPFFVLLLRKKIRSGSRAGRNALAAAVFLILVYFLLWVFFQVNFNIMILPLILMVLARILKSLQEVQNPEARGA